MKITYIYGIRALDVDKFIWVGKSNKPEDRFEGHMICSGNDCVQKFVEEKGRGNFRLEILEKVKFKVSAGWIEREGFWIERLRSEGHPLCNKNNGGGGPTEHTEETKQKMRNSQAEYFKMHGGRNKGPRSEECKAKTSASLTGHTVSVETRQKIGKASQGNEYHAKSYPTFYNEQTGEMIPAGNNFTKMCREHGLNHGTMYSIKTGRNHMNRDGWRLATDLEDRKFVKCKSED